MQIQNKRSFHLSHSELSSDLMEWNFHLWTFSSGSWIELCCVSSIGWLVSGMVRVDWIVKIAIAKKFVDHSIVNEIQTKSVNAGQHVIFSYEITQHYFLRFSGGAAVDRPTTPMDPVGSGDRCADIMGHRILSQDDHLREDIAARSSTKGSCVDHR